MEATSSGEARLEGVHCSMVIRRPGRRVVLVAISGRDGGELGDAPFEELRKDVESGAVDLFIDARATSGASMAVSHEWAQWLQRHRTRLSSIHMLTGSKFIELTADLVRRFAQLGELMRIYSEPSAFEAALRERTD
jgi:hypothetical protein